MRIIHGTWQAKQYGIETFLLNLLSYQNNSFKDLKADVVFHATNEEGEQQYRRKGVEFYSLGASNGKDIKLFFKFYKIFKNYDLVNLHTYSPWAFFAAKFAGKKVVFTFHGALGLKGEWLDFFVKMFYYVVLSKYCDCFTFASRSSFERFVNGFKNIRLRHAKYQIFPYGIKLTKIKSQKTKEEVRGYFNWDNKFIIGTAARMDPVKRLEYLINAFRSLENKKDFLLIIMGTGDKNYENYLRDLVHRYQLADYVQFLGYRADVYDILNALDLFILPTKEEPFGLALIEAMALGVPSIVFNDGGGTVDILGNSGVIVSSLEELCGAVEKLKKGDYLRKKLSTSVKERAKLFDISFTAKNLYNIYTKLLRRKEKS